MGVPLQQGRQQHRDVQIVVPVTKSDPDASLLPVVPKRIMLSSVRITPPCVMRMRRKVGFHVTDVAFHVNNSCFMVGSLTVPNMVPPHSPGGPGMFMKPIVGRAHTTFPCSV